MSVKFFFIIVQSRNLLNRKNTCVRELKKTTGAMINMKTPNVVNYLIEDLFFFRFKIDDIVGNRYRLFDIYIYT